MADGVIAAKAIQERLEEGALARFVSVTKRAAGMVASLSNRVRAAEGGSGGPGWIGGRVGHGLVDDVVHSNSVALRRI